MREILATCGAVIALAATLSLPWWLGDLFFSDARYPLSPIRTYGVGLFVILCGILAAGACVPIVLLMEHLFTAFRDYFRRLWL